MKSHCMCVQMRACVCMCFRMIVSVSLCVVYKNSWKTERPGGGKGELGRGGGGGRGEWGSNEEEGVQVEELRARAGKQTCWLAAEDFY